MVVHITYVFLTFLVSSATSTPPRRNERAASESRLPQDIIIPEHYDLEISIDETSFEHMIFGGTLDIKLKVLNETSEIKLNSYWTINIIKAPILSSEVKNQTVSLKKSNFTPDNDTQILTIETVTPLTANTTYFLRLKYLGALSSHTKGLFLTDYETHNGRRKYIITTNFKPSNARRTFPCFDEPIFKATFSIKIIHPKEYNALGNTRSTTAPYPDGENYTVTTFHQTSQMSTYLVAFMISDLDCDEAPKATIAYQVCSRSETASTRRFALEMGPKIVNILEKYLNTSYVDENLTKLSQVAIPSNLVQSADSSGLGIFSELNLLYDESESSSIDQQKIGIVLTHQLSHRWFGDLITIDWWSDIFLNEGLAIYSSYFSAQEVLSGWELNKHYSMDIMLPMLNTDSLQSTTPLSLEISTPQEIEDITRKIPFKKASAMIHMVANMMDLDTFEGGVRNYVTNNRYGNVKPEHLWNAFGNSIPVPEGETLSGVMENWVKKPGYPVVSVLLNGSHIIFSQERFLSDGSQAKNDEKWFIPLTWTTWDNKNRFNDTLPKGWLTPTRDLIVKNFLGENEANWIVVNVQLTGYYRVKYEKILQRRLHKALFKNNFDGIYDINRAQMVDDYFNLALAKVRTFEEFFEFLKFMMVDDSYYTWHSTFTVFHTMLYRINKKQILENFAKYILKLMDTVYNTVKTESKDEDHIYTLKRILVLEWACLLGHKECIRMTKEEFKKYIDNDRKPNRNLKFVVYCNGLRYSDHPATEWNKLWEEYKKSESLKEKRLILSALVCVNDTDVFKGFLSKAIYSGILEQDSPVVFSLVTRSNLLNRDKINICLEFLIKNYESISTLYKHDKDILKNIFTNLAERFTSSKQMQQFKDFLNKNEETLPENYRIAWTSAIDKATENLRLTELFEQAVSNFLEIEQHSAEDNENADDVTSASHVKIASTALITILMIVFQRLLI